MRACRIARRAEQLRVLPLRLPFTAAVIPPITSAPMEGVLDWPVADSPILSASFTVFPHRHTIGPARRPRWALFSRPACEHVDRLFLAALGFFEVAAMSVPTHAVLPTKWPGIS